MNGTTASDNLVWSNPLIRRYSRSLFRRSHLWVYLTIYISVVLLLLFLNVVGRELDEESAIGRTFFQGLYHQFLMAEIAILWVWSALNSRSALREEVANKTYDFFRLLPLSALQKAVGILVGKNLLCLLLAVVTLVPMTLFGLLGGLPVSLQAQILLVVASVAFCVNAVVLLSSSASAKRQGKMGVGMGLVLLVFFGPFVFGPGLALLRAGAWLQEAATHHVTFYRIEVPVLMLIIFLALYFGLWNLLGILRKFTFEGALLFTRPAAILFLLGYELIVLGLFLPHLPGGKISLYSSWLVVSLLPVLSIPTGSINDRARYLEALGRRPAHPGSSGRGMLSLLLQQCNLSLGIVLFAIWLVFFVTVSHSERIATAQLIKDAVVLASCYVFLLLLLELCVVYEPIHGKIRVLIMFVLLLYLFLPLILAATLAVPSLHLYSPLGFLADFTSFDTPRRAGLWMAVLGVNVALGVVPALAIRRQYMQILSLRRTM